MLEVLPELVAVTAATGQSFASQLLMRYEVAYLQGSGGRAVWYVQEYDLSRRHSLHLSYWTDGDTRRRGETFCVSSRCTLTPAC